MAMSQKDRDQATKDRRNKAGEVELRHRVRPGILKMLRDLMAWGAFSQIAECIQTLIMNVHALGPSGAKRFLTIPRHDYEPSENVARQIYEAGARESGRLDQKDG